MCYSTIVPVNNLLSISIKSFFASQWCLIDTFYNRGYFSKARSIAELRSPSRDDGTVARILWKTAQVLLDDVSGEGNEEAQQLLDRANLAKAKLVASGESADRCVDKPIPIISTQNTPVEVWSYSKVALLLWIEYEPLAEA